MLDHIAITINDLEKAEIFFAEILSIPKVYNFTISPILAKGIFGIEKELTVTVFAKSGMKIETFLIKDNVKPIYDHICLKVKSKQEIIKKCKKYGADFNIVKNGDRKLLFIKDFSDNLYEIKEEL
jgi:catechol 2,3-dioxygenase-like lactoylglutathione lyase family enzyme